MQVQPLQNNVSPSDPQKADRIRHVAEEFESLFTSMLVRSMRKTVGDGGLLERSLGERMYTDMLDDAYARNMASQGTLGLADLIVKQIQRQEGGAENLESPDGLRTHPWEFDNTFLGRRMPVARPLPDAGALYQRVLPWSGLIDEASERYGVDRNLVASVVAKESAGDPQAVSPAGAKGLMQLMDTTARDLGVQQVFDPRSNIMAGTRYLSDLLRKYNGNQDLALASYNAGPSAVDKYNGVPPYRETQEYVAGIRHLRARFAQLGSTE